LSVAEKLVKGRRYLYFTKRGRGKEERPENGIHKKQREAVEKSAAHRPKKQKKCKAVRTSALAFRKKQDRVQCSRLVAQKTGRAPNG